CHAVPAPRCEDVGDHQRTGHDRGDTGQRAEAVLRAGTPPGGVDQLVEVDPARRWLADRRVQGVSQLFHDISSRLRTGPSRARNESSARAVWLFTVPVAQPSTSAVSSTERSQKNRRTRTARRRAGSSLRRARKAIRSARSCPDGLTESGSTARLCSRRHGRRRSSSQARSSVRRAYASMLSIVDTRRQCRNSLTSAVDTRSSAVCQSPQSRYAVRRSWSIRPATYSRYPATSVNAGHPLASSPGKRDG